MKATRTLALSTIALMMMGTTASAAVLADGLYKLGNHPDGSAAPPLYGLRLDGLGTGGVSGIYTFDFENNGAAMYMDLDVANNSIHIYGQVYGGLHSGSTWNATESGLWNVDFTYTTGITSTGQIEVNGKDDVNNYGSITPLFTGGAFTNGTAIGLWTWPMPYPDGLNFTLDTGHRGFAGFSGWGWLSYGDSAPGTHKDASDWLFTVGDKIPVPGAVLLGTIGLSLIGVLKRRFA